jgi:dolichol-phosphate mannosyltransferase
MSNESTVRGSELISVVIPVYNEGENIVSCLRGVTRALCDTVYEILVVFDFDEDTTLPSIRSMQDAPPYLRLVKNDRGKGVANALRVGLAAAQGDVVVTTMADLSDPPQLIQRMAEKIRAGADVVSGSRYMTGGSQSGGPWLKSLLSRAAGLSLYYIAGMGTHDATTNFRGYSRRFLDSVEIESEGGFEVALELTVKAHLQGRRLDEVPSSWIERSEGKSRFRLVTWLPKYFKWYVRAIVGRVSSQRRDAENSA